MLWSVEVLFGGREVFSVNLAHGLMSSLNLEAEESRFLWYPLRFEKIDMAIEKATHAAYFHQESKDDDHLVYDQRLLQERKRR